MRTSAVPVCAVGLALLALGAAARPALGQTQGGAPAQRAATRPEARRSAIAVEMIGFRSHRGKVLVALFSSAAGFPDAPAKAVRRAEVTIRGRRTSALFRGLPPGTYAVAVLHDEDGNHKMRMGVFGPKEGYGASRDARGRFGPPRFDDARMTLRAGQTLRIRIRMSNP